MFVTHSFKIYSINIPARAPEEKGVYCLIYLSVCSSFCMSVSGGNKNVCRIFLQQLFIAGAWDFNTVCLIMLCHTLGYNFVPISRQLPLNWRLCLYLALNFKRVFVKDFSATRPIYRRYLNFYHTLCLDMPYVGIFYTNGTSTSTSCLINN